MILTSAKPCETPPPPPGPSAAIQALEELYRANTPVPPSAAAVERANIGGKAVTVLAENSAHGKAYQDVVTSPRGYRAYGTEMQSEMEILKRKLGVLNSALIGWSDPCGAAHEAAQEYKKMARHRDKIRQDKLIQERAQRHKEAEEKEAQLKAAQSVKDIEITRRRLAEEVMLREKEKDLDARQQKLDALLERRRVRKLQPLQSTPNINSQVTNKAEEIATAVAPPPVSTPVALCSTPPSSSPTKLAPLPLTKRAPLPTQVPRPGLANLTTAALTHELQAYTAIKDQLQREKAFIKSRLGTVESILHQLQHLITQKKKKWQRQHQKDASDKYKTNVLEPAPFYGLSLLVSVEEACKKDADGNGSEVHPSQVFPELYALFDLATEMVEEGEPTQQHVHVDENGEELDGTSLEVVRLATEEPQTGLQLLASAAGTPSPPSPLAALQAMANTFDGLESLELVLGAGDGGA
eukprot:TRINITY_DN75107_c0_g1_i1.p1 TRINITY_DN75107_c0_g1~~TRINITY_DN75107_c0_g1_i1.p1  ORF type:complete len:467 (+),score=50.44 TRINITY_DN75107_c0_g1_i1:78-1478(+)